MKIVVAGLGIIGASLCASLKSAGHTVYGKNRSSAPVEYALVHGMMDGEATSYAGADVVFLALPPAVTARELDCGKFDDNCIVADICGVKECLETLVYSKKRNYRYVGTHPMAGKETNGITSASETLFKRANFILCEHPETDPSALSTVEQLGKDMGFGSLVYCTAKEHDKKIAVSSQLAHVVSNAYVKSEEAQNCRGFTGGSFQDMTRIAGVDEFTWTELYFANRENLLEETEHLIARLCEYRDALKRGDEQEMQRLLREGRLARASMTKGK